MRLDGLPLCVQRAGVDAAEGEANPGWVELELEIDLRGGQLTCRLSERSRDNLPGFGDGFRRRDGHVGIACTYCSEAQQAKRRWGCVGQRSSFTFGGGIMIALLVVPSVPAAFLVVAICRSAAVRRHHCSAYWRRVLGF